MRGAADDQEPLTRLRAALGGCGPAEDPLRDLVIARLRKDSKTLRSIVESDAPSYEGSMNTVRVFLSTKAWPEKDHGWIEEALTLARHGNWFSKRERPSYARKDGGDRPGTPLTTEMFFASVLLADCARHAAFSNNKDTEPDGGTCLDIIDAACRLGGEWPGAAVRFLADHASFGLDDEAWRYDPVLDATRGVAVPLALLVARRWTEGDTELPVRELFESIDALALQRGVEDRGWNDPLWHVSKNGPRVIRATVLDPVLDRLTPEAREAAARVCTRFIR
ncbi:MAG: hypothetical protein AAGF47_10170 [Planctomycetota bacterium]